MNIVLPIALIVFIVKSTKQEQVFHQITSEWLGEIRAQNERLRQRIDRRKYMHKKYNT